MYCCEGLRQPPFVLLLKVGWFKLKHWEVKMVSWREVDCWKYAGDEICEHLGRIWCLECSIMTKFWSRWQGCALVKILELILRRAAWETCNATWILITLHLLCDRGKSRKSVSGGRSQDLPEAHWLLASSPAVRHTLPAEPTYAVAL